MIGLDFEFVFNLLIYNWDRPIIYEYNMNKKSYNFHTLEKKNPDVNRKEVLYS